MIKITKNRIHKGDFSKLSTGEFPVPTGPVLALVFRVARRHHCLLSLYYHLNTAKISNYDLP
jgi:hypothetical protein